MRAAATSTVDGPVRRVSVSGPSESRTCDRVVRDTTTPFRAMRPPPFDQLAKDRPSALAWLPDAGTSKRRILGRMIEEASYWQGRLAALAEEHGVVGASLAIQTGSQVLTAATGALNLETGHLVTPDALFQVG